MNAIFHVYKIELILSLGRKNNNHLSFLITSLLAQASLVQFHLDEIIRKNLSHFVLKYLKEFVISSLFEIVSVISPE